MNLKSLYLRFECRRSRGESGADGGFTLIEILIVTVIVGILAAIAFPAYQRWIDKTRYAEARVQMNCLAKELQAFKLENGFFPEDVARNVPPRGIECFYTTGSGQVPFNSLYDYENWPATGGRHIQITFLGKNGAKEHPNNTVIFAEPGFYEYGTDDLILSLGTN